MDIDLTKGHNVLRINIHYKITAIFGIITAGILFGIYLYLNNGLKEHTFQRIKANLLKETRLTKSFLEANFTESFQSQQLDTIADKIGRDLDKRVTIINREGKVLGDSELNEKELMEVENHLYRPEVQEALKSGIGESRRFSTTIKKDMFYIAATFGIEKPRGIVRLAMPLSEIEIVSGRLRNTIIISLLLAFILTIIISFIVSIFISKPIKEMSWAAKSIAGGDYSRKINVATNDEIKDLAEAFNYMSRQIRLRIEDVTLSKSRLEAVLLSMFEGVMVVDKKGTILLINQTLKDLLQVKEELIGRKPLEVIRNIEIQEIVDNALRLDKGVESREISLLLDEGKVLMVHATPIVRDKGIDGAVLVFHDITGLRRLEKIRQDFVANVSHELRTPVTSIKGYAETLLEGALEDKENARDFLKIIYSDSDRLARLIDDLLDLSKIESGKLRMVLKPCALMPIVDRVIRGLERYAKDKSITIKSDIPKDIPNLLADESRIAQVLLNLIDNAIKYTENKGLITISAKKQDKFVRIDVSDVGVGIPEKDLPRIFERFYRVDKARSRELGGTGLGLSIVKHIVQAHNGEVFVKSLVAQGSTFSFIIPKA